MTITERLIKYVSIIAKERMDDRLKIIDTKTGQSRIIATFDDLKETLSLGKSYKSRAQPNEGKRKLDNRRKKEDGKPPRNYN